MIQRIQITYGNSRLQKKLEMAFSLLFFLYFTLTIFSIFGLHRATTKVSLFLSRKMKFVYLQLLFDTNVYRHLVQKNLLGFLAS